MKIALTAFAAALIAATTLADNQVRTRKLSGAERRAKRAAMIKAEGGLVTKPYSGRYIVIENAQKTIAENDLVPQGQGISDIFQFPVKIVKKGERGTKTAIHITVSDDQGAPTLLIAPEIPWAQVNVRSLAADGANGDVLIARTQKEIWRAFMMCCGASNSNMRPCIMRTIRSLADLDAESIRVPCPESMMKVWNAGEMLGLNRPEIMTYKAACKAGWAPAPTNDVQRAIFDEFKKK